MSKFVINKKKNKNLPKEDLLKLTKEELVDRIIQLEAHNLQLRNILGKRNDKEAESFHDKEIEVEASHKSKKVKTFDFSKCNFRRIFLRLAYLGGKYQGLATQEDSIHTIEHFLFTALTKTQLIPSRDKANYHRCGRTDKGVSASGQVISLLIRSKLSEEEINTSKGNLENELPYCKMLNRLLPSDIRAVCWMPVAAAKENGEPPSARFDCKYRTYKYWFPKCFMDVEAMQEACKYLEGSHDFRNLCKMDVGNGVTEFVRNIYSAEIVSVDSGLKHDHYSMYYLKIIGNAFLWHQIRCIAAVLFLVGNKKEEPTIMKNLLDIQAFPNKPQYNLAIDLPLNLFHCSYEEYQESEKKHSTIFYDENSTYFTKKNWYFEHDNLVHVIKTFHELWIQATVQSSIIKDIIEELLTYYSSEEIDGIKPEIFHGDSLIQGVKAKNYIPLAKRPTCEPLESRIEHYVKKKRIEMIHFEASPSEDQEMEEMICE